MNLRGAAVLPLLLPPHSSLALERGTLSRRERVLSFPPQGVRPLHLVLCKEHWAETPRSGLLGMGVSPGVANPAQDG